MPVTCNWLTVSSTCSEANAQHIALLSFETHQWMTETLIFKTQSGKVPPDCLRTEWFIALVAVTKTPPKERKRKNMQQASPHCLSFIAAIQ